ncbi:MAG: HD-GYP domain-containing protein [Candidatus Cloacimonetes bacterium]|nr:HD-GYP domain-containing protein [Candidatus Cloacimonadota bacterium]
MINIKNRLPSFKEMKLNILTLTFHGDLESNYINDYYKKSIYQVRISFFLAVLLYGFFGLLDMNLASEMRNMMWLIRFSVIVPIGLLVLVTSYAKDFDKYRDITMAFTMILFSIGLLIMTIITPKPVDFAYYAILMVTFVFVYTFIGIRFISATLTGIIILLLYEITALFIIKTPLAIISKNNFIFLSTNLVGRFAAYSIEFYSRRDFFITTILENNQNEMTELNDELEERISVQTEELVKTNRGLIKEIEFREKVEKELLSTNVKLNKLLNDTVTGLVSAIEYRDPYTAGHQRRVTQLAVAIAGKMKLSKDEVDCIRIAAMIHDIGKINIPVEILSKPGSINQYELELMQNHPQAGYDILKEIEFPWPVAEAVHQHHERLDGSGYPNGLKGDDIMLESRVIYVADVVEAMSSHRPYRPALGVQKALDELKINKGKLYDDHIVDACLKLFNKDNFEFEKKTSY